jgi:hypothetical protein
MERTKRGIVADMWRLRKMILWLEDYRLDEKTKNKMNRDEWIDKRRFIFNIMDTSYKEDFRDTVLRLYRQFYNLPVRTVNELKEGEKRRFNKRLGYINDILQVAQDKNYIVENRYSSNEILPTKEGRAFTEWLKFLDVVCDYYQRLFKTLGVLGIGALLGYVGGFLAGVVPTPPEILQILIDNLPK